MNKTKSAFKKIIKGLLLPLTSKGKVGLSLVLADEVKFMGGVRR